MLQLREDHESAFREAAMTHFEDRGIAHVRSVLGEQTAPFTDGQLRDRIKDCVARAAHYGLTTERQIMYFVDSTFVAGEHFDSAPGGDDAREVLTDPKLAGDDKGMLTLNAAQGMAQK